MKPILIPADQGAASSRIGTAALVLTATILMLASRAWSEETETMPHLPYTAIRPAAHQKAAGPWLVTSDQSIDLGKLNRLVNDGHASDDVNVDAADDDSVLVSDLVPQTEASPVGIAPAVADRIDRRLPVAELQQADFCDDCPTECACDNCPTKYAADETPACDCGALPTIPVVEPVAFEPSRVPPPLNRETLDHLVSETAEWADSGCPCGERDCQWGCEPCSTCDTGCSVDSCRPSRWSFREEAMFMNRSNPQGNQPLIQCACAPSTIFLSPRDLDFDGATAARFTVAGEFPGDCDGYLGDGPLTLEMSYFDLDGYRQNRFLTGDLIVLGIPIGTGDSTVQYTSELSSFEFNAVKRVSNWTSVLAGFRALELDERATIIGTGTAVGDYGIRAETHNQMYGGQIGVYQTLWDRGGNFTVEARGKVGAYYNALKRSATALPYLRDTTTSFVGELEARGRYEITRHIALTAGYEFLWLDSVALIGEQSPDPAADINADGNPFFHGATVGLELVW